MSLWCWLVRWYRPKPTTFEQMRLVIKQYDDEKALARNRRTSVVPSLNPRGNRQEARSNV